MKSIFTSIIFSTCLALGSIHGQDLHFSQFYMSPLNLNPALTGVMNCNHRVVVNYRNQWSSILRSNSFRTYSASYDHKIPVGRDDYFGVGGVLWGDVAGSADFQTLSARVSGSYSRKMFGNRTTSHYLVVGAEAGIGQRSLDFQKLRFGDQHDGNGGFAGGQSQDHELLGNDNFIFPDVSAGFLWFSVFDENNNAYIGGAIHHLNRPNLSFYTTGDAPLYSKITAHAGGQFEMLNNVSLIPGVVAFFQGPSFLLNVGSSVRFNLASSGINNSFQVGLWARMVNNYLFNVDVSDPNTNTNTELGADAIIFSARFLYDQFDIGFSYDWNVSDLKAVSNGNGALELSLVYTICGGENRGVYCPKF